MYTALIIVVLFILCWKSIEDLHETTSIALRFDPETKLHPVAAMAYNTVEWYKKK